METLLHSGNPKAKLDHYFPPQQDGLSNSAEGHRCVLCESHIQRSEGALCQCMQLAEQIYRNSCASSERLMMSPVADPSWLVHRQQELAVGLLTPAGAQALLDKYPPEHVEATMLKYVAEGRSAMGQPILKVVNPSLSLMQWEYA